MPILWAAWLLTAPAAALAQTAQPRIRWDVIDLALLVQRLQLYLGDFWLLVE